MATSAGSVFVSLFGRFERRDFDRYHAEVAKAERRKAVETELKGDFRPREFKVYEEALARSRRQSEQRSKLKTALGGDFDARAFRQYTRAIERSEAEASRMARAQSRLASTGRSVWGRGGSMVASIGVAYGVGTAIRSAAGATVEFDRGMQNVNSIAQLSQKDLGDLKQSVLDLAGKTAQAPGTLAEGLYDLVSSGFEASDAIKVLEASARAATAGLTTTDVASKGVAATLNAYRLGAEKASYVSDVLFKTVDRGVITFDVLAQNIGTVLPFAASLGVGVDQVGAAIATMTKQGISGQLSITYLKNAMVGILKPSTGMAEAIKATGFESGEALVKAKGFQGALELLRGTTDGSKKELATLFPNIRALTAGLALTGENARGANKDLDGFGKSAGSTSRALEEQSKSISYQWNKAKATFAAVSIELGTKLAPTAIKALKGVSGFVQEMKDGEGAGGAFVDTVKELGGTLIAAAKPAVAIGRAIGNFAKDNPKLAETAAAFAIIGGAATKIMKLTGLGGILKLGFGRGNTPATPLFVRDVLGLPGGKGPGVAPVPGGKLGGLARWAPEIAAIAASVVAGVKIAQGGKTQDRYEIPTTGGARQFVNRNAPALGALFSLGDSRSDLKRFGDEVDKLRGKLDKVRPTRLLELRSAAWKLTEKYPDNRGLPRLIRDINRQLGVDLPKTLAFLDRQWDGMTDAPKKNLRTIRGVVDVNMSSIRRSIRRGSLESKIAMAQNFNGAVLAVREAMKAGTVSTRDGLREIRKLMLRELALFGIKGQAARNYLSNPTGDTAGKGSVGQPGSGQGAAVGGWIVDPAAVGPDSVRMDVPVGSGVFNRHQLPYVQDALGARGIALEDLMRRGGGGRTAPVVVAPGEALVPPSSMPTIDAALRDRFGAGVDSLFAQVSRPHHLASGGVAGRMVALARQIKARGPYSVGENQALADAGLGSGVTTNRHKRYPPYDHYSGGAIDVNADGARGGEGPWLDRLAAWLRGGGWHVLWRVKGHFDHLHVDASQGGSGGAGGTRPFKKVPRQVAGGGGALRGIVQSGLDAMVGLANARLKSAAEVPAEGAGAGGGGGASRAQVQSWLSRALRITGNYSPSNLRALTGRAMQESGGNPKAINLWDSNAKAGHPSKGLLQTIDSTFQAHKMKGHDDIWNPVDNAVAAIRYMLARYGRIVGPSSSGYAKGGKVGGGPIAEIMRRGWRAARGRFPGGAPSSAPDYVVSKLRKGVYAHVAYQQRKGRRRVALTPDMVRDLRNGDPYALGALVHEWAHTQQDPRLAIQPEWIVEGGAEGWTRRHAGPIWRAAGIIAPGARVSGATGSKYGGYLRRVMQTRGLGNRFVSSGQFLGGRFPDMDRIYAPLDGSTGRMRAAVGGLVQHFDKGGSVKKPKGRLVTPGIQADTSSTARLSYASLRRALRVRVKAYDSAIDDADDAETEYNQLDRKYNLSDEEFLNEDGSLNKAAIAKRWSELSSLIRARQRIIKALERARKVAVRVIQNLHSVLGTLRGMLKAASGSSKAARSRRKTYRDAIADYQEQLDTWRENLHDLDVEKIPDARLDLAETKNERQELAQLKPETRDSDPVSDATDSVDASTAGPTPDQEAITNQIQARLDAVLKGFDAQAKALAILGPAGTFPQPGYEGGEYNPSGRRYVKTKRSMDDDDDDRRIVKSKRSRDAPLVEQNIYALAANDPQVLRAVGDAATQGISLAPNKPATKRKVGHL